MPTKQLTDFKIVDVRLPSEIVDLLDEWATRADMSRTNVLSQIVRIGMVDAGRALRIYRQKDYEILERNNWHKPKYID